MIIQPNKKSLKKALDDGYIDKEFYKKMLVPLNSKCKDDIVFHGMIIRNEIAKKITENLNDEQKYVYKQILEYIFDPEPSIRACLLNGSAGTGKTTVISKILYTVSILCPMYEINANAPTHKAIKLLQSKCNNCFNSGNITFDTTHSTLGLRMVVETDGKIKFKGNPNTTTNISLMFVDEVSMIEDDLFKLILDSKTYSKTRIVLIGDRKQLPPVNSKDSYIFTNAKNHNVTQYNLTQIVRQVSDNPIVKLTKFIGDRIDNPLGFTLKQEITEEGNGVIIRTEENLDKVLRYWYSLDETKVNPDNIRVLAWTNKKVDECNKKIRNILFENPEEPFVPGDRIIAKEPLFYHGEQFANNSDEFTVDYCTTVFRNMTVPISNEIIEIKFYEIYVMELKNPILLVHEDSLPLYNQKLSDLKGYCIAHQRDIKAQKNWIKYYDMKQWNSEINYSYAGTIHTAQGSTYNNAIVMLKDLESNRNFLDKNKLRYTAFTRAKYKLIIIV